MTDTAESVRAFRAALADAISRSRHARGDATEQALEFQRHTREIAGQQDPDETPEDETAEDGAREAALAYRDKAGLVDDFSAPEQNSQAHTPEAVDSQEQAPSDGSDLDFSQAQIMR